ncbi:unnamed protein product [Cuscuta campestris]|uniref:Uncharacterized protein n=1 Tax=Cuscuta campestris TaxID=132261 RepID=A0A484KHL1_9ASTE|nr:unnamed protein product [Cuscuta campestris]
MSETSKDFSKQTKILQSGRLHKNRMSRYNPLKAKDCKKHNLDNVAKAAIFKTLDPITFSKIKHLKTAMEIWQGLGKLCEGSEDLRKQKIEVLLEKFKSFKMLPGESFDMLDERFHKILNDLASLNHILSPKEKNVRLLRSLPTEWYTKATAMEEGRNLENYTLQGLLDELRTYEHELKKKKEEQVTPFPTALMTTPRIPSSEGTCTRNCDTPSSSQLSSSKMENYNEEFAMMVKQFRKFKKFFKKADSVRRPSKGKPQVEKYGERERNEKKKKAMVAAENDESSSSSSDEEALICMERRVEKSNHEDRWTMSEDDTLSLMAKDDADQGVTPQTSCSSSYSIPTSEILFDQFKKMMEDFEEINLKHSSLTEENKLLSEENLKLTESQKSQLNEITQLKTENESLSEKVKSLNKELGILKSKEAVNKLLETTKHKGREGLGFDPSNSKRKGKTTFISPKPTTKPNKQKGKEKEKPTEVPKKLVSPKNYRKLDRPQKGNNFRRKPSNPQYTRGYTHYGVDRSFPRNSEWRTMPRYSHTPPQKLFVTPKYAYNRHRSHYAQPRQNYRSYQPRFARRKQKIAPPARRKFYAYNYDYNPNKFRAARKIPCNFKLDVGTHTINYSGPKLNWRNPDSNGAEPSGNFGQPSNIPDISNGDNSGNGDPVPIHPETPTTSVLQPEAELDQPVNPNQHNLRWLRDHPPQQVIGDIQSGVRTRSAQQNLEAMLAGLISQVVGANVHFQKLEAKCSSLAFYQSHLEMIAAQELSEFLQMEIRLKFEEEVLEFYKNGEVKTVHSKKDPQRKLQVIKSTVGGRKVKLSQKNLGEKLHLPNSGVEIGRFPVKNLDWNIFGISGQAPSGQVKKADLNNDYKLVLELVIACLECGSGGQLMTSRRREPSSSTKYLCQGLYIGHILESMGAASKGKKYEERYWLYYLSSKGENRAGASATAEESSSDNVPLINLTKTAKRKQVMSSSLSVEAPKNHVPVNLEEAEEVSVQRELQRTKKRKITSPSTSGYPEKEIPEKSAEIPEQSTFPETNEEEQAVEAQRSSAEAEKETQMAELEASKSPVAIFEEHNEAEERDSLSRDISNFILEEAEEESERTLRINDEEDVQEDTESLPMQLFQRTPSSHQVTNFHFHSSSIPSLPDEVPETWTKKVQGLIESALASQRASFRQEIEQMEARYNKLIKKSEETHCSNLKEISKSVDKTLEIISLLSNIVRNTMETYASDSYLQLKEVNKIREQIANITVSLQKQMSLLQMDIRSALAVSSENQVVTKDYLKVIIDNQKEAHKLFRLLTTNSGNRKMEVVLQQHSPSLIPELPIAVKEGEVSYIPTHLNLTDLILDAPRSNPENSTHHLSSSGLDGTEVVGTIAAHFSNDNQTEERRNNIRRIKELCGNMQGIMEIPGSSKRKKH